MIALDKPTTQPWTTPDQYWPALSRATEGLDTPFAAVSVPALAHNAHDMLARANGTPIRVASKSVRVRGVIESVLALPGYHGVLAYTLAEALWLAETIDDIVVGLRPLFVTKDVAAQVLGCSLSLVNGYIRLRMLPVSYHGTKPVVAIKELEKFAARLPTEPRTLGL